MKDSYFKLKNTILLLTRGLVFSYLTNSHIRNIVLTLSNVVKFGVKNDSYFSVLSNVAYLSVEIDNVDSTRINAVNSIVDVHNVVSMKQRWNVYWDKGFN